MTQAHVCFCPSGMLVVADTNVTVRHSALVRTGLLRKEEITWPSGFVSHEGKVALSRSGVAVVLVGSAGTREEAIETDMESFVGSSDLPFDELKSSLVKRLKERYDTEGMILVFAGYDGPEGRKRARVERMTVTTGDTILVNTSSPNIIVEGSGRNISCRLLDPWVHVLRENCLTEVRTLPMLDYTSFSLDDFARLSVFLIRVSENFMSFVDNGANEVGGPIDMLMLLPDGTSRWLSRHTPASVAEPPDMLDTRVPDSLLPSQAIREVS